MPLDPSILGGAAFLAGSGALLYAGAVAGVVREALRPERRTIAWALARGTPSEADLGLPIGVRRSLAVRPCGLGSTA